MELWQCGEYRVLSNWKQMKPLNETSRPQSHRHLFTAPVNKFTSLSNLLRP